MALDVAAELNRRIGERQIQFIVSPTLVANGDERFLRVLLDNLLGNAWKYTGHREAATVELGMRDDKGEAVYFVKDNGAGFDMSRAKELFAPFKRLHSTDEFTGTGLGLATCKRIIDRHGGRIWAESQVSVGTTFYFTLGDPLPN
jgi:light-regulated signal transduction histidine kinase (bacteriophytochrome)